MYSTFINGGKGKFRWWQLQKYRTVCKVWQQHLRTFGKFYIIIIHNLLCISLLMYTHNLIQ